MPRFFFDVIGNTGEQRDDDGIELASEYEVPLEAARFLNDLARDELQNTSGANLRVSVRNQSNQEVYQGNLKFTGGWLEPI